MSCSILDDVSTFIGSGGLAYGEQTLHPSFQPKIAPADPRTPLNSTSLSTFAPSTPPPTPPPPPPGYGGLNPGPSYPNAPMRVGPDTTTTILDLSYRHYSGYNYDDDLIRGFSHTHYAGAGINGLGHLGMMPIRLDSPFNQTESTISSWLEKHSYGWWSHFDKASEKASPGSYSVYLTDPAVNVELLATSTHSSLHRYSWDADDYAKLYSPTLVFDLCHAAKLSDGVNGGKYCEVATFTPSSDGNSFDAAIKFAGEPNLHFHVDLSFPENDSRLHPPSATFLTCFGDDSSSRPKCTRSPEAPITSSSGLLLTTASFGAVRPSASSAQPFVVEVRVAMSYLNAAQAAANNNAGNPASLSASDLKSKTREAWCAALQPFSFEALEGDEELAIILSTALMRTKLTPARYDEGGFYLGFDNTVRNVFAEREAAYSSSSSDPNSSPAFWALSDFSLWDTFRTQNPWLLLTDEPFSVGMLRSFAEITSQLGVFPKWTSSNRERGCMVGYHGAALIADAVKSNISGENFGLKTMYDSLLAQATVEGHQGGRQDLAHYLSQGYVSAEASDKAAPLTLTYAYDDYILGVLASSLNEDDVADASFSRALNYKNVFNASRAVMCPRTEAGAFACPKSDMSWNSYIEGNDLQWTYFVPHDVEGLIDLHESHAKFDEKLESFLADHIEYEEKFGSAVPNPKYWAGNEVDLQAVWMFAYGQNCSRTQFWSRSLTNMHFHSTANGIPGNDDYATMSAWLVFASLGLYPQTGTTNYYIGSPRVKNATLMLKKFGGAPDAKLEIVTYDNSKDNVYVKELIVNGEKYNSAIIDKAVLSAGAKLEFFMSAEPVSGLC